MTTYTVALGTWGTQNFPLMYTDTPANISSDEAMPQTSTRVPEAPGVCSESLVERAVTHFPGQAWRPRVLVEWGCLIVGIYKCLECVYLICNPFTFKGPEIQNSPESCRGYLGRKQRSWCSHASVLAFNNLTPACVSQSMPMR